jgi:hypothetical protein
VCARAEGEETDQYVKKSMTEKSKFHTNSEVHGAPEHVHLVYIMNNNDNYKTTQTHTL